LAGQASRAPLGDENRRRRVLLNQRPVHRFLFWRDHHSRGHTVSRFDLQQAYTLGRASGFADVLTLDADDFAVLADQHHFGILLHLGNANDFAIALGRFNVDHTRTAASLQTIFVCWSALAVAILGD